MSVYTEITLCDDEAVQRVYCPAPTPTPTPTPEPTPIDMCDPDLPQRPGSVEAGASLLPPPPSCCNNSVEHGICLLNGGTWDDFNCSCVSPIVIDVDGDGFDLTNAQNGVLFDIMNTGGHSRVSWTAAGSDDAWLSLDRNKNGRIDRGRELFGSSSPQPPLRPGEFKNGFRALAVFDKVRRGGNNDGRISPQDQVYESLRLWQDINHNGISEPNELFGLRALGLRSIDLDYTEHRRQDEHGNWFRLRSRVRDYSGNQLGRWAWDVFLDVHDPSENIASRSDVFSSRSMSAQIINSFRPNQRGLEEFVIH